MMMIAGFWCVMMMIVALGETRGPHHPRGKAIMQHTHYRPTKNVAPVKFLEDLELLHDKEHIQEHLEEIIDEPVDLSKLTDEELEFYYFQLHDTDKNEKLDGLEILQAIIHTTHSNNQAGVVDNDDETHSDNDIKYRPNKYEDEAKKKMQEEKDFQYYVEIIDRVLQDDDFDQDGYLSYPEYASGRKKAIIAERIQEASVKLI